MSALEAAVRRALEDAPIAHLVARVVEWPDGQAGWALVDRIALAYTGQPYDRRLTRVVALIEVEHQTVGIG